MKRDDDRFEAVGHKWEVSQKILWFVNWEAQFNLKVASKKWCMQWWIMGPNFWVHIAKLSGR